MLAVFCKYILKLEVDKSQFNIDEIYKDIEFEFANKEGKQKRNCIWILSNIFERFITITIGFER